MDSGVSVFKKSFVVAKVTKNLLRDTMIHLPPVDRRREQLFPLRRLEPVSLYGIAWLFVDLITNSRTSNPLSLDK